MMQEIFQFALRACIKLFLDPIDRMLARRELASEPYPMLDHDEIVLISVMRNEEAIIEEFLAYYFAMGVSHVFLVDHQSTDGTVKRALRFSNVHIFQTQGNFRRKEFWIETLLQRFANDRWSVIVDADEFLAYPEVEKLDLQRFINYLEQSGHDAFQCKLIDLFPGREQHAPRFDPSLQARQVLFGVDACLEKVPLLKYRKSMRLLSGQHRLIGGQFSPLRGAVLHYKFLNPHLISKSALYVQSASWNRLVDPWAYKELKSYQQGRRDYHHPSLSHLTTFENTRQLARLGLVKSTADYQAYVEQSISHAPAKAWTLPAISVPDSTM